MTFDPMGNKIKAESVKMGSSVLHIISLRLIPCTKHKRREQNADTQNHEKQKRVRDDQSDILRDHEPNLLFMNCSEIARTLQQTS